uniref:Cellular inhibitor of PP2A n=1 Tax=Sander lucioperca TaxID=283035 RepID=A0A8D0AY88_SANLU
MCLQCCGTCCVYLQEVSGLKCDQLLSSGQVLPRECVSGLVELAGNPNTNQTLTGSIISLLAKLACDDDSREILNSSYNLTSTLASVIHCHSATAGEPLVLQCLQVLQKLTYNTRVFQSTNYIHELIAFLMTNIQSQNEDIIMPCLGLMANLCRDNHSVQSHIKSLDNVKRFYRTLINFLAHNSLTVVIFTLSILASLTLNEKVGEKLFDAKNIHQTFQLVFNIIVNGNGTQTRKYSVDLLIDLLKNPKIADHLTKYQHFSACVSQVLGLLQSKDPDSAGKVLELLLAMCSVSGLRSLLCEVVFRPAAPKLRAVSRRQGTGLDGGRKTESGLALVQWLSSPVDGAESCSLQALQLLNELLEHWYKRVRVVCFSQVCAEALLTTLELMSKLRQQVKDMETSFYRMLQDQRIVTPLSLALTSQHRERVQTGLSLLFEATPLPDFPSLVLGESMAANNAYCQREAELSVKRVAVQEVPPFSILDCSSGSSRSVHSLVDKIQNGLEVKCVRVCWGKILLSCISKESRLQDLLDAKALALSQADRLIAQYRFQRAQAEAEACKLGCLLKEAERRREDLQGELSSQVLEVERSKADMEELLQHNARLQQDSEEHQALKGAYNSLLNRFNESERLLKELQTAHISLTKQNDTLRKNHEALQLQRELEETVDVLRKELNKTEQARKDASIKASSLELQKSQLETKLKQKEDELNKHSSMIAMIHSLSSGKLKSDVNLSL